MPKKAISVTLEAENLLWLRGQVRASGRKSVSDVIDHLVRYARSGSGVHESGIRSVVGAISLAADDPDLAGADEEVRRLFHRPAGRDGAAPQPRGYPRATASPRKRARHG